MLMKVLGVYGGDTGKAKGVTQSCAWSCIEPTPPYTDGLTVPGDGCTIALWLRRVGTQKQINDKPTSKDQKGCGAAATSVTGALLPLASLLSCKNKCSTFIKKTQICRYVWMLIPFFSAGPGQGNSADDWQTGIIIIIITGMGSSGAASTPVVLSSASQP
ncbi:hypothetical protein E2C01_007356 [Portunus trituberculatus]|uniref:Uncharacterized protein n=1 Tax=Portunus trituberculatus TaxID=210409 RepID=A0A5B7CZ86_PORTR|nr:hypothetical protein [Portunus trituberculatus]